MMRFNGVVCVEWQWGQSMNRWLGKNFSAQPGYQTGKRFPKFRRSVLTVSITHIGILADVFPLNPLDLGG